jgi:predicted dinucleotide-binding enzyme
MKITVVGAGHIGGTLAGALGRAGHDVTVGVRSPEGRAVEHAAVVSIGDALHAAEVVILALPGRDVEAFLAEHGAALEGVVVVDAANSIGEPGPLHHAEAFERHAPGALMVRAFNNLGWENYADPSFDGERTDLYWCGPAGRASEVAQQLIADVGLRPVRVGGTDQIDVVDGVLRLWFALVQEHGGGRHLAFRTLGV